MALGLGRGEEDEDLYEMVGSAGPELGEEGAFIYRSEEEEEQEDVRGSPLALLYGVKKCEESFAA